MDWNNDGRKDLLTGEYDGHIRVYLNTGTDANPVFGGYSYVKVAGANWICTYSKPEVVDWNNDGKVDLLCGDSDGYLNLALNVSTTGVPLFNSARRIYDGGSPIYIGDESGRSSPVVVDWNRDGKKDLIVGTAMGTLRYYENKGTDANPVFNGYKYLTTCDGKQINVGYFARPEIADWDNDGWMDLVVGSDEPSEADLWEGHVFYFHALSGPYLKSYTFRDANNNGFLERGEQFSLTTVLTNSGSLVTGVVASLSTTCSWCTVTVSNWDLGDFPVNRSYNNATQPFAFSLSSNAPFGAFLPMTLEIAGNGGAYHQRHALNFETAKPWFSIADLLVNDSAGNNNCACNPGETVQLLIKLKNTGYRADGVTGQLTSSTPGVVMIKNTASFGTIERNAQAVDWQAPFAFVVPSTMPSNAIYAFTLKLSFLDGSQATNLPVTLGDYVVTSNTPFAWVNMTGATRASVTDESYQTLPLIMSFPFYGIRTNYVQLVSNGYLMFGSPYTSYGGAIPSISKPNCVIAPWWEDLDPGAGGTVRYRLFGTAPNRYWVAEWDKVPRYYYETDLRSFQVILYEDGSIKFQYGNIVGSSSYPTIGLENPTGTQGKTWNYPVANGVALLFSVQAGTADSDHDGLPDAWERFYFGSLARNGLEDSDHDGLNNAAELAAGTHPLEAASRLWLDEVRLVSPNQARLRWQGIPGRLYSVWTNADQSFTVWNRLTSSMLGAGSGTNDFFTTVLPVPGVQGFRVSTP